MGKSTSKATETQRLLGGGDDSDARSAAASVPPPSADYGTTSPPRVASPPVTRKAQSAGRRDLGPTRHSELSEEGEDDDDDDTNSESLTSETIPSPAERRRTVLRFILLWSSISTVTIYLIVEAFRRGGGEFDWRGALRKAAGGGIAGAMAMVIQVLTLMPLRTIMKCVSRTPSFFPRSQLLTLATSRCSSLAINIDMARLQRKRARLCMPKVDYRVSGPVSRPLSYKDPSVREHRLRTWYRYKAQFADRTTMARQPALATRLLKLASLPSSRRTRSCRGCRVRSRRCLLRSSVPCSAWS